MLILLSVVAVAVMVGAAFLMWKMDQSSRSQGGRFYVVLGGLLILGALDNQVGRMLYRISRTIVTESPIERRYRILSLLAMILLAALLIGLAFILP
jgi:hypothetical protein